MKTIRLSLAAGLISLLTASYTLADTQYSTEIKLTAKTVEQAMNADHRSPNNIARNQYRHPADILAFFGLKADMTVVEIWPGGGWYSEILAPVLKDHGQYYAAGFSLIAERTPDWRKNYQRKFEEKLKQNPEVYGKTIVTDLSIPERTEIAPAGTADLVLTFRNVHNWMKGEYAQDVFNSMYKALKPGGLLGVVEHRAKPNTSLEDMITSGYVTEAHVIKLAKTAGFKLEARSEINGNAKDSSQHPKGVWTLPPSLRLGDKDRAKYLAIGESDRMTLKFVKPSAALKTP
ncbi:MAG: putative methyltransferase [Oleispira sp.]|jgi:predicted methyltransferase